MVTATPTREGALSSLPLPLMMLLCMSAGNNIITSINNVLQMNLRLVIVVVMGNFNVITIIKVIVILYDII